MLRASWIARSALRSHAIFAVTSLKRRPLVARQPISIVGLVPARQAGKENLSVEVGRVLDQTSDGPFVLSLQTPRCASCRLQA